MARLDRQIGARWWVGGDGDDSTLNPADVKAADRWRLGLALLMERLQCVPLCGW